MSRRESGAGDEPPDRLASNVAPQAADQRAAPPPGSDESAAGDGETPAEVRPRGRARRWLRRAALALVVWLAVYAVAANVFLVPSVGSDLINANPEKVTVAWAKAFSPLPGLVRVTDLTVRGQNLKHQWYIEIDRAWVRIGLLPLTLKRLQIDALSARGVDFRLRPNRFEGDRPADPEERRAQARGDRELPPVPGLELPTTATREQLRPPEDPWRRWHLSFSRTRATGVRSIWIGRYRLAGSGDAAGEVSYRFRGDLEIADTRTEWTEARLAAGSDGVIAEGAFSLEGFELAPFDPGDEEPGEVLRGLDGDLELDLRVVGLGFLTRVVGRQPWLDLDGEGRVRGSLSVEDGEVLPGSALAAELERLRAEVLGHQVSGSGEVAARVDGGDGGEGPGSTRLDAIFDDFEVENPRGEVLVAGEGFRVESSGGPLSLSEPPGRRRFAVVLPESRLPSLAALNAYLPASAGAFFEGGRGVLSARLENRGDQQGDPGRGEILVDLERAALRLGSTRMESDGRIAVDLASIEGGAKRMELGRSVVELEDLIVTSDPDPERRGPWRGRLVAERGTLDLEPPWSLQAETSMILDDSRPVVAAFVERKAFLRWFRALLDVREVEGRARVIASPDELHLRDLVVEGGEDDKVELRAQWDLVEDGRRSGVLFARYGRLSVGLELLPEGGKDWKLTRSREWYERRAAAWGAD